MAWPPMHITSPGAVDLPMAGSGARTVRGPGIPAHEPGTLAEIVARAQREHRYQVPGASTRAIIDGNPDYLGWIARETETASEQSHRPPT